MSNVTDLVACQAETARRLAKLGKVYLEYPIVKQALDGIHDLRLYGYRPQSGNAACCYLLTGPTGSGKTSLFNRYMNRDDARPVDGRLPVICMTVPTPFNATAFYTRLLVALGEHPGNQSLELLKQRAKMYLADKGVELILMEELQHVIDQKEQKAKIPYFAADTIKETILDGAKVPVAFNGTGIAAEVFERNAQLKERRDGHTHLAPWAWDIEDERHAFCVAIEAFEKAADFPEKSGLTSEAVGERLHRATSGILGDLAKLFKIAIQVGTARGAKAIDQALLAEAHARLSTPYRGWQNALSIPVLPPLEQADASRVTPLHEKEEKKKKRNMAPKL